MIIMGSIKCWSGFGNMVIKSQAEHHADQSANTIVADRGLPEEENGILGKLASRQSGVTGTEELRKVKEWSNGKHKSTTFSSNIFNIYRLVISVIVDTINIIQKPNSCSSPIPHSKGLNRPLPFPAATLRP